MTFQRKMLHGMFAAMTMFAVSSSAMADGDRDDARYCMDVDIQPFHMVPGFMTEYGACAVRDYWGGALQDAFYPFTKQDHLFNCDYYSELPPYFGGLAPLPTGDWVPSSVVSEGMISGTIGGHPFSATLFCASQTNWYQASCTDPDDPTSCKYGLVQPDAFLERPDPYPRVTEVSVFDGEIAVSRGKKTRNIPIVMATRAAGITHIESLDFTAPQVGASITHSLLGMVVHDGEGDDARVLDGSVDLLLQGHIFFPDTVANDPKAARIKGSICSEDLYRLLNKRGKGRKGGHDHDDNDDDDDDD